MDDNSIVRWRHPLSEFVLQKVRVGILNSYEGPSVLSLPWEDPPIDQDVSHAVLCTNPPPLKRGECMLATQSPTASALCKARRKQAARGLAAMVPLVCRAEDLHIFRQRDKFMQEVRP
jgi:hypothetical protein